MSTLESTFQVYLIAGINAPGRPTRVWRQNAGRAERRRGGHTFSIQLAPEGAADLVGLCFPDGLHLEVECKGARTRRKPEQDRWQRIIERNGGVYVQVRYDEAQSLEENVARCVAEIDASVAERRLRGAIARADLALVRAGGRE